SERRDASRCGEGIGIEGSRVLHLRFPWSGLQAGQDIGATGHAAARQAARQDLGEGGQIRSNTIVGLGAPGMDTKSSNDFIKDQESPQACGHITKGPQKLPANRDRAKVPSGWLQDYTSDLAVVC